MMNKVFLLVVTPFAGVWIEIHNGREVWPHLTVTPFAGVWIEIATAWSLSFELIVTPFAGVWIEIQRRLRSILTEPRHSLRGSVDWNNDSILTDEETERHSLRGSVDWNSVTYDAQENTELVTPFAGVWIEIGSQWKPGWIAQVTPFAGVWIEIACGVSVYESAVVTPFAGVWIEMMQYPLKQACSPSLPSRECGLKYAKNLGLLLIRLSLPSRECGLKFFWFY